MLPTPDFLTDFVVPSGLMVSAGGSSSTVQIAETPTGLVPLYPGDVDSPVMCLKRLEVICLSPPSAGVTEFLIGAGSPALAVVNNEPTQLRVVAPNPTGTRYVWEFPTPYRARSGIFLTLSANGGGWIIMPNGYMA